MTHDVALRRELLPGLAVSALTFGVSGPHGGIVSERATARLIAQALAGGITLFDTAPFYGDAQARLGRALRGQAGAQILTKAGTFGAWHNRSKDFRPDVIRRSLEDSLRALGVERVAGLLLHGPGAADLNDDLRGALEAMLAQGKLAGYGVCGRGPEVAAAIRLRFGALIQAPVWGADGGANPDIADAAAAGMAFIGIEAARAAAARRRRLRSLADLWALARAARGDPLVGPTRSVAAAIQTALAIEGVTTLAVTTTRAAHLAENLAAAKG